MPAAAAAVDVPSVRTVLRTWSDLANAVAFGGKRFRVLRRGKPVLALVSVEDLERLEREKR